LDATVGAGLVGSGGLVAAGAVVGAGAGVACGCAGALVGAGGLVGSGVGDAHAASAPSAISANKVNRNKRDIFSPPRKKFYSRVCLTREFKKDLFLKICINDSLFVYSFSIH
jgi:hypothetical protein